MAGDVPCSVLGIGGWSTRCLRPHPPPTEFTVWRGRKSTQLTIRDLRLRKTPQITQANGFPVLKVLGAMPALPGLNTSSDGDLTLTQRGMVFAFTWRSSIHAFRPSSNVTFIPGCSSLLEQTHFLRGRELLPLDLQDMRRPLSRVTDLNRDPSVQPGTLVLQPFHAAPPGSPSHLLRAEVHTLVHGHVRHGRCHRQGQGEVVGPAEAASEDGAAIWRARGRGRRQIAAGRTTF